MSEMRPRIVLHRLEPGEWTDDELSRELREDYEKPVIPPCAICGAELTVARAGGGEPTVYVCSHLEDDPENLGTLRTKAGRRAGDDHYEKSRVIDRRQGGDDRVMELLRRFAEQRVAR